MTAGRRYSRAAPLSNLFCYMGCPHSIIVRQPGMNYQPCLMAVIDGALRQPS